MTKKELQTYRQHRAIMDKHLSQMHQELGEFYGYPKCCINQFIKESKLEIQPAIYRYATHGIPFNDPEFSIGYVPCDKCMKRMIKEKIK